MEWTLGRGYGGGGVREGLWRGRLGRGYGGGEIKVRPNKTNNNSRS